MSRLVAGAVLAGLTYSTSAEMVSQDFYENVVPADTADCLKKISALPLSTYEIKHDSVKGRRHLGPVGPDLEKTLPGSIEVHGKSTVPSPKKGEPPIILERQVVVDKNVIFMNNVAAVQELAAQTEDMWAQMEEQLEARDHMRTAIEDVGRKIKAEIDEQLVQRNRIAKAEAEEARLTEDLELVKAEEAQRALEVEALQQREALEKQVEITRHKLAAESESKRAETEHALEVQEESIRRREALRLETETQLRRRRMDLEQEMDAKKLQMDSERARAEVEAKVAAEQQNQDVLLRKIRAQGEEDRRRTQEAIKTVLAHLASAGVGLMSDPRRMLMLTSWILGLVAGYLVLKESTLLLRQLVEASLGKPGLVRETSRVGVLTSTMQRLRCVANTMGKIFCDEKGESPSAEKHWSPSRGVSGRADAVYTFRDVVLAPDLKEQVLSFAVATRNSKRNGAPYRHLLLYGPPGTGKTMVAKRLAACSGMDYAVMSGGDVGPLGQDAVTQLHGLFRGLLLFIDEAEAFLGKRSSPGMSEDTRNALNALLHHTGSASRKLMMVLATNRAEDLDEAVLDRMDDSLLFPIPDKKSRGQLLVQYYHKYCSTKEHIASTGVLRGLALKLSGWWLGGAAEEFVIGAGVDERLVRGLSEEIQGFSGREVEKLMLGVQSCVYGSEDGVLTADVLKRVVTQKAKEHDAKVKMVAPTHA